MPVRMMHIRHMRVLVPQTDMLVTVRMRLSRWIVGSMPVLMMDVVNMGMHVLHRLVLMIVFVHFRQMKPDADTHQ